ncbi:hypothetical protein QM012_009574 [Aureobasidium pullulans]|uniref:Uncharacterized protein n=1 Tax=Aureobasidium pullulans TaxID=5580 RepID=A0ABR0TH89_AURPU
MSVACLRTALTHSLKRLSSKPKKYQRWSIADRLIKDTVDRLAERVSSNKNQPHSFTTMLDHFFQGLRDDKRRKGLEARVKENSEWSGLGCIEQGSLEEALEEYAEKVEMLAQENAAEDVKEIIDASLASRKKKSTRQTIFRLQIA